MQRKFAIAILLGGILADCSAAAKSDTKLLLRWASQGYMINGRKIAPTPVDPAEILRIADHGKSPQQKLARLIIARDLVGDTKQENEQLYGQRLREAAGVARSAVRDSVMEQVDIMQMGEPGVFADRLDSAIGALEQVTPEVSRVIESQKKRYVNSTNAWIMERSIAEQTAEFIRAKWELKPEEISERFSFRRDGYKSDQRAHAAFQLTNRSSKPLAWAIVIVAIDCQWKPSEGRAASQELSDFLFSAVTGQSAPDYAGRDQAFQEYSNVDKSAMVFVEDWKPKQVIKVVSISAPEYVGTAQKTTVTVIGPGFETKDEVDVDIYKKWLRARYEPRPKRSLGTRRKRR